ncbi:MAG: hypothetical protein V1725_03365 [archaeon]
MILKILKNVLPIESRVETIKEGFRSILVTEEDEKSVVYVGETIQLYREDDAVRGRATLTAYERETKRVWKNKIQWHPFTIIPCPKTNVKDTPLWSIASGSYNHEYFISRGKTTNGIDCWAHYKGGIWVRAQDKNISVTRAVLDEVFSPLDKLILADYNDGKIQVENA